MEKKRNINHSNYNNSKRNKKPENEHKQIKAEQRKYNNSKRNKKPEKVRRNRAGESKNTNNKERTNKISAITNEDNKK